MSRVLIVDDEPWLVELFSAVVEHGGHVVVGTAGDGDGAVAKFEEVFPACDIVLMDHRMPGMSGAEATREITNRHPGSKVLIVTADQAVVPHATSYGAVGVLEKPFDNRELLERIDEVVDGMASVDEAIA